MNETITIGDETYEVLTLDRICEITHAKLAGGKVTTVLRRLTALKVFIPNGSGEYHCWQPSELAGFGIQPLKLIERKPVEFVGRCFGGSVHPTSQHIMLEVPLGAPVEIGKHYKLTQIMEEA